MKALGNQNTPLDDTDAKILEALIDDARCSMAALARLVGLSAPSVAERVRRLEEAGVIQGYTLRINPKALGRPIGVWLRIRPMPGQLQKVADILRGLPEVVECDRITGEDCFMARAYLRGVEDMEGLIDKVIPYAMTTTSVIQSSPVPARLLPVREHRRRR